MKTRPDALIQHRSWVDTRDYLRYCAEVLNAGVGSLKLYRVALDHLLRWATRYPLGRAPELRPTFPRHLYDLGDLSVAYRQKLLDIAASFFEWASERYPDRYSQTNNIWRKTLRATDKDTQPDEAELYTLDEVLTLIAVPATTLTLERDRAAAAFLFLSGIRAQAFCTLPLEAVRLSDNLAVRQWPSLGVKTKGEKAATTYLLRTTEVQPLLRIVREWDKKARDILGKRGMWYSLLERDQTFSNVQVPGLSRPNNLRDSLRELCNLAGLPFKSAHKFRHGFAVYALAHCHSWDDFKAVSQNLMHESIATTDKIYSRMMSDQVAERIARLGKNPLENMDADTMNLFVDLFQKAMK